MAADDFLPSSDDSSDKSSSSQDAGSNQKISTERYRRFITSDNPYKPRFAPNFVSDLPGFYSSLHRLAASEKWQMEILLGRPLTKDEEAALKELSSREFNVVRRTKTITELVGTALGLWRAYRTRFIWKFPFRKPSGVFNADVMHLRPTSIVLRGPAVRNTWKISRFAAYGFVGAASGLTLGMVTSNIPAFFAGAREWIADPRAKELIEVSKELRKEKEAWKEKEKADRENYKMVENAFHYAMDKMFQQRLQKRWESKPWWRRLFWRDERSKEEIGNEFGKFFWEGMERQLPEEDQRQIREAREKKEQEK